MKYREILEVKKEKKDVQYFFDELGDLDDTRALGFYGILKDNTYYLLSSDSENPSIFQKATPKDQKRLKMHFKKKLMRFVDKKEFQTALAGEFHGKTIKIEDKTRGWSEGE